MPSVPEGRDKAWTEVMGKNRHTSDEEICRLTMLPPS